MFVNKISVKLLNDKIRLIRPFPSSNEINDGITLTDQSRDQTESSPLLALVRILVLKASYM